MTGQAFKVKGKKRKGAQLMSGRQSAELERKKFFSDPILICTAGIFGAVYFISAADAAG